MKNNYILGIDIGIASVGYGVMDKDNNVVDQGVRLFESGNSEKNQERRTARGRRRLIRRKKYRIKRFYKLFPEEWKDIYAKNNILDLKIKGLKEPLNKEELFLILRHYLKYRGISYLEDALNNDENKGKITDYKELVIKNQKMLKEKSVSEIQKENQISNGKYRGETNVFTTGKIKDEILKILEKSKAKNSFLTPDFIEKYIEIFESKRKYYEGPGDEYNRTDYGKYRENGEIWENIFEILIGNCTIYGEERRGSKNSYTAQKFNLLNDLNNTKISGRSITKDEKDKILKELLEGKRPSIVKIICKICKCEENQLSGYRVDKDGKPTYTKFETYRKMRNSYFEEFNTEIEKHSIKILDKIFDCLTINTDRESILSGIKKIEDFYNIEFSKEEIEFFYKIKSKNPSLFSGWHSFSYKLMYEIMEELEESNKNQSAILHELGKFKNLEERYKGLSKIPEKDISKEIYNPVVSKSVTQSIKVINALKKKYGDFEEIVIEMAREDNEDDEKTKKKKFMDENAKLLSKIENQIENTLGITIKDEFYRNHKNLKLKLKLWYSQKEKCLYSGKNISINDLINNQNLFEVDHIVPISISFDDSFNNKVLVYQKENALKSNKTPYYYLMQKSGDWTYTTYKNFVLNLEKEKLINVKKRRLLLMEEDIKKQDVIEGFINRNLNDTRYSARVVLNTLQSFMKANNIETKIKVINGSFTNQFRKTLRLDKDREESYAHHGIDALICCLSTNSYNRYQLQRKNIIDFETGEILDEKAFDKMTSEEKENQLITSYNRHDLHHRLKKAEEKMKYSFVVDKKINRQISDETKYSTRNVDNVDYVVGYIKDIYDTKEYDRFIKKYKSSKESFLMYKHDKKTWDILEKIIEHYPKEKEIGGKKIKVSPFLLYKEEHGIFRKYSKKGNGAPIKKLKFLDKKLGNHIDISNNFNTKNKKVVLQSLNPYRADIFQSKKTGKFKLVRISYNDFRFKGKDYNLDISIYNEKLKRFDKNGYYDISNNAFCEEMEYEFLFSLYKNNRILIKYKGEEDEFRFLSPREDGKKFKLKPVNRSKTEGKEDGILERSIGTIEKFIKINTDILGEKHYIKKEKIKMSFSLDKKQ